MLFIVCGFNNREFLIFGDEFSDLLVEILPLFLASLSISYDIQKFMVLRSTIISLGDFKSTFGLRRPIFSRVMAAKDVGC